MHAATGEFLGLITCNARLANGEIIPNINFSIPSSVLRPVFEFAQSTRGTLDFFESSFMFDLNPSEDMSLLELYSQKDDETSILWRLNDPVSATFAKTRLAKHIGPVQSHL